MDEKLLSIVQAYLTADNRLITDDTTVDWNRPTWNNLFSVAQDDSLDKTRPVTIVRIYEFSTSDAPQKILGKAQKTFLETDFAFYQPIIFIASESGWDDTNQPSIPRLRAFRVTDSSIWNYHLRFDDQGNYDTERLSWVLKSLDANYKRGLYHLHASCEYANLNARLIQQSYLAGSHAPISPFIFHSEYDMRVKAEEEAKTFCRLYCNKDSGEDLRWRILLVDDKSITPMEATPSGETTKLTIIKPLLQELFPDKTIVSRKYDSKDNVDDSFMLIEYAETVKDGLDALNNKKYDIVLLDYLLSESGGKNYGYKLLEEIKKKEDENPTGRTQFFMFISAYVTAVNERLSAIPLERDIKDVWHISEGACPTNTPNRFKLLFLRLMKKRITDSGLENLSASYIAKLAHKIFEEKEDLPSVRNRANNYYQKCLSLLYHYKRIIKDVQIPYKEAALFDIHESVLMTSMFQNHPQLGGFLEHFCNLVHITAFGTVRQWPEMWEEYIYFRTQLRDIYQPCTPEDVTYEDLCKEIEKHIKNLKES